MSRNCIMIAFLATAACSSLPSDPGQTSSGGQTGGSTSGQGTFNGPTTRLIGRAAEANGGTLLSWSGSGVETRFTGQTLTASLTLSQSPASVYFNVIVDGKTQDTPINVTQGKTSYSINCGSNGTHEVRLIKRTEAGLGQVVFGGFTPDSGSLQATATPSSRRIEVIGDSITCGYGVLGFADANGNSSNCPSPSADYYAQGPLENSDEAYGALLGEALGADVTVVAWSGKGIYRNDDASMTQTIPDLYAFNDFSDASNPAAAWSFPSDSAPDAIVINLGTNDFSASQSANPPQQAFVNAYATFVQTLRGKYPNAQIILVSGGPMLSDFYPSGLKQSTTSNQYVAAVVAQLGDSKVTNVQVATQDTTQGTGCLSHPLPAEQQAMATQLATSVKSLLGW